ncbi:MAG: hypothetical protein Q8L27_02330 [archaeon]|nr:hypothetical protein [archaeon]
MKFNFKKIASVLATTAMLGSTIAFAAAAYPEPFVKDGVGDAAIVVGSGDGVSATDTVAATDLGSSLDAKITAATSASLSGEGDKAAIDTSARKIYYEDAINAAKTSLSTSEMPNVLADGKVVSLTGTEYAYTQSIVLGSTVSALGTSGGDLNDPALYLDVGTDATAPLYNYTLAFNKNLNTTDATNVQGQKIKILGVDYVIGASSTGTTLYLYGAGETVQITGGETKTVTIDGKEHVIELTSTSSTTSGKIVVDGVAKTVTKGSSYAYAGDLNVYVKDITHPAFAGDIRDAELIIGANTLLLSTGSTVKVGADQTSTAGTKATLTATADTLSSFTVSIAMKKSQLDQISLGDSFTDPVFGGLKVQLVSITPPLTDSSRANVVVSTDNNQYAYVTFTSVRAGDNGEQKIAYSYDNDTASATVQPLLAHTSLASNKGYIHVLEGQRAKINDWIVVNQGDSGTILNVDDITFDTTTSGTVTFSDVITGESQKVTLTAAVAAAEQFTKTGVNFFGGNGYTIAASNATGVTTANTVNITWSGAGLKTLYPRIKLKDGGWISILATESIKNGTQVILPDGLTTLATTGTVLGNETGTTQVNGITWGFAGNSSATVTDTFGLGLGDAVRIQNISAGAGQCNLTAGPAILYIEPKKWNDGSFGDYICIPMSRTGTTELAIDTPIINGTDSGFQTLGSDTYKKVAVDQYGAYVTMESRTNENGVATIAIPTSQMYLDIKLTSEAVSASTKETVKVVKDTEVSSVSSKNLIVIGGSCINQAAAMILTGATDAVCGDAFSALTGAGAGKYLIQVAASPYNAAKVAMLVAGYDAADTTSAVAKVKEGQESTTVGSMTVYPLETA